MGRGLVIAVLVLAATAMGALVHPTQASSSREDEMRGQIGQLLNLERTNRGLAALPVDQSLADSAQAWSEHNRDSGCEANCHSPHSEGEILAWGDVTARSGRLVVAWMQSTAHRNIALYPDATAMGVGVACKSKGEVYATVQYYGVFQPVQPTDEQPTNTSQDWGAPCVGSEGAMPAAASSATPATQPPTTTTTTTAAPPSTTAARPQPRPAPPTTAAPRAAAPVAADPTTTTSPPATSTTTTTAPIPTTTTPRIGLRSDGTGITADAAAARHQEALAFKNSTAAPANAEPAWVAIVVVVVLLSGLRVGAQLRESRAQRRLEDG